MGTGHFKQRNGSMTVMVFVLFFDAVGLKKSYRGELSSPLSEELN